MSIYSFQLNQQYNRSEIRAAVGLDPKSKGGSIDTGYVQLNGADFVFCTVGGTSRTGHNYNNYFEGKDLIWRGKTNSHIHQPTIERMTGADAEVHVFWRVGDRDPFTYAGLGKAAAVWDETPVRVRWRFSADQGLVKLLRSSKRLPAIELKKIGQDHVHQAVQLIRDGSAEHQFGPSTDYDLIDSDGVRLPPKAVFGLAARLALGFDVLPGHFTAGETSPCFRILRRAGYQIVPKEMQDESINGFAEDSQDEPALELSEDDREWVEGRPKLIRHLVRERAKGLAQAKRLRFKRDHGKLFCERCKLDPVEFYGSIDGEACIEVHHSETQVSEMKQGHKTHLDSLQCLCANCHRLVHKQLKEGYPT
ncbi:hypothetical protein [Janthinobacterium sp. GW458P]|uniref:HNH endonuclease n=1 Tax=Janthinobacterium sp. GW458P TaxID=1981504 RepID=UPI00111CD713|nr:hypothetical protein [Janthinobacterium sp. GW458P]MBE3023088.1 hypothetical protein [Janthinobacterium sp. GW458P]